MSRKKAVWSGPATGARARFLKRFGQARQGGVALIFALAMPPITLMAVAGVDVHRASSVQQNLKDALDAAALAAARSDATTSAGVREVGMRALQANMAAFPNVTLLTDAASTTFVLNADGSVDGVARARVETLVADMFLGDAIEVSAENKIFRSNYRIEVALVIDNTGSMDSNGKLEAARDAAASLVERLEAADARSAEEDAVRISLVPFSMTVRVHEGFPDGQSVSRANQISWLSNATNHTGATGATGLLDTGRGRFTLFDRMNVGWDGCIESRPWPYDTTDTPPDPDIQASLFVPYFSPDDPDQNAYTKDNTWKNYSRDNNYLPDGLPQVKTNNPFDDNQERIDAWMTRVRREAKYGTSGLDLSGGRGPNHGCNLVPIVRLTDDFDAVQDGIADMNATGNTNIPIGLMWGWHTLSPNAPFSDGRPYGEERLQKIIILLTDGDNVNSTASNPDNSTYAGVGLIWQERLSRPNPNGVTIGRTSSETARRNEMDYRLETLCENLRENEVYLYTVGVQVSSRTQTLLRECATEDDMFYNVTNTAGIEQAFDRIAGQIENLRIAE